MKIIRFRKDNNIQYGIMEDQNVYALDGDILENFTKGKKLYALSEVKLLAPVNPQTIICLAANYSKGLIALGRKIPTQPDLFFKSHSALCADGDGIPYPKISKQIAFGGEMAVIMKKAATKVSEAKALDYVLGYTCSNDMMTVDLGNTDRFPTRAKGFFNFFPLGPCISTGLDGNNLRIGYTVNGKTVCDENTNGMIFNIQTCISYISQFMTLEPLDVISMGSPVREEDVFIGDVIAITVEGIGTLTNPVVKET
jgi:2-keto-4-pentenoate hydratase/2-oxohepta-3-ene-1,7-dioic acid hydratase in catechol pathway